MLSLVFIVPHRVPFSLAIALFVLGSSRGLGLIRQLAHVGRDKAHRPRGLDILRQYALPLLACLGLLTVATAALLSATVAIYGLVLVIAALLTTASWNAWLLFVREKHR